MNRTQLVLVHGWGSDGRIWQPLLDKLGDRHAIHLLDLNPMLEQANACEQVLEQMHTQTPADALWVGSSLGGTLASLLTAHAPGHIASLCTIGTSPCFVQRDDWQAAMAAQTFAEFEQGLEQDPLRTCRRFQALATRGTECSRRSLRRLGELTSHLRLRLAALHLGLRILRESDLRPVWADARQPHQALFGRADRLVPARAASDCPTGNNVRTEVIDGHHLPWLSQPQAIADRLAKLPIGEAA